MIAAYVSGHGLGHLTRLCEVMREVRARAPDVPICLVGSAPEALARRGVPGPLEIRGVACDVGLVQKDALTIDESATAARCRAFEASFGARLDSEVEFLRSRGAKVVVGDIPPLAFAAASRAGVRSFAVGNFSWDWIYRHLSRREASLATSAAVAANAYRETGLLLELPFAGDLSAFARREAVGFVARRPVIAREDARRRLGLDDRPAVLLSFGGFGVAALSSSTAGPPADPSFQWLYPDHLTVERLDHLRLGYPDVVGAVDVVVTKPGYGIVSDAIGAGTRIVYTDRGDFPEYGVMVEEMPRYLACVHVPRERLRPAELGGALREVLRRPMPAAPDLRGAARCAERIVAAIG